MDKIQEIIEELRLYCGMDENGQLIINKLLQELSKTKKLHEIFKQNEPSKDTEILADKIAKSLCVQDVIEFSDLERFTEAIDKAIKA